MLNHPNSPPQFPLPWATAWGEDQYGLWIELSVGKARQIFRWIEPGEFKMGSPNGEAERRENEVLHHVCLKPGFWLADTTVTQELWQSIMKDNHSRFKGAQKPVERVSWHDTQQFLKALKAKTAIGFSLPSEEQWEYACRAGTSTVFSLGNKITSKQVNFDGQYPYADAEKSEYRQQTIAVKSLPSNAWGLYEMHGNVWEWCQDIYQQDVSAQPQKVSQVDAKSALRVLRGGSCFNSGGSVRSAIRNHDGPDNRYFSTGFRLSLSLDG